MTASTTNLQSATGGPFIAKWPVNPSGWTTYGYSADTALGLFTVSASGDSTTASAP